MFPRGLLKKQKFKEVVDSQKKYGILSMNHLQVAFVVWIIGIALASMVFFIEIKYVRTFEYTP